ncbi:hypothetical protein, partial [Streptomyces sp. NPDC051129]|uniref:hypothetical protein n=1 Tax=Streptomyces sp. NPDC051129 TaxID=3154639 RepID=UPI003414C123
SGSIQPHITSVITNRTAIPDQLIKPPKRHALVPLCDRLGEHADPEKRELTGLNPVDRGTYESKIQLITKQTGLPSGLGESGSASAEPRVWPGRGTAA